MLYLLDASVLITANRDYYPILRVPEYWEWLKHHGSAGRIKIPEEIYEEVKDGPDDGEKDPLFGWLQETDVREALVLDESCDPAYVQAVVSAYAPDLSDDEIEKIGRDPFLIAYALAAPGERCVVTLEVSRPGAQRSNRRIPDVCNELGVISCNTFKLNADLGFSTSWNKP